MNRLWRFAEHADWYGWRPRWFWRALLRWQDQRNGMYGGTARLFMCQTRKACRLTMALKHMCGSASHDPK